MSEIFLFPLPNSVTLKNISIPYHIFEHRYKTMINDAIEHGMDIAVLIQSKDGNYEDRLCIAGYPTILNIYDNGRMDIVITGKSKYRLGKCKKQGPYLIYSAVEISESINLLEDELNDLELIKELIWEYVDSQQVLKNQKENLERIFTDPETIVSYANLLLINDSECKQRLMEFSTLSEKVKEIISILSPTEISLGKFMTPIKIK